MSVSEPSIFALSGIGLLGMLGFTQRKRYSYT
ncbi:PEP-CTERM sorting domain-containing protein [Nitrosomonas sp. Nm51]